MAINADTMNSSTEANSVIDFSEVDESTVAKDEEVLEISKRLFIQNKEAYEVLAK